MKTSKDIFMDEQIRTGIINNDRQKTLGREGYLIVRKHEKLLQEAQPTKLIFKK